VNLHHRRIIPLMEKINPVSLVRSQLIHDRFPREYAATRVRLAISLKAVRHSDDDLWLFIMLPDAPPVRKLPPFPLFLRDAASWL
jgi:hypothetical protein